ncbi:MAG: recombination protein RecR [Myxococcales bacterium]|nr:recombination protein RecR [Myxococcales bacterium]USN50210.1 MAG: recombination protein RecR [Myxococcales bacterium]
MAHDPVARLIKELTLLPGIGERTALRLALHLLGQKKERVLNLAESLVEVAQNVTECRTCCNLTAYSEQCSICSKPGRDDSIVCVVSCIQDLMAIESCASFKGLYHVLHGVLTPINGIGPKELRINELSLRLAQNNIKELILATPSSVEGEATALFIGEQAQSFDIKISRIASGVPVGGDLQFADRLSLARALMMRQEVSS